MLMYILQKLFMIIHTIKQINKKAMNIFNILTLIFLKQVMATNTAINKGFKLKYLQGITRHGIRTTLHPEVDPF